MATPHALPPRFSSESSSPEGTAAGGEKNTSGKKRKTSDKPKGSKNKGKKETEDTEETPDHDHKALPSADDDDDDDGDNGDTCGLDVSGILEMDGDPKSSSKASKKPAARSKGGAKKRPSTNKNEALPLTKKGSHAK